MSPHYWRWSMYSIQLLKWERMSSLRKLFWRALMLYRADGSRQ